MAGRATATPPDWRAEQRDQARLLQRLADQPVEDLTWQELRELEHHYDPKIAARAADEISKRGQSDSKAI